MGTSWVESDVCSAFEAYRDLPEQILGYRYVFQGLDLQRKDCHTILDYGCGPGKVALRLAEMSDKTILGVDLSPDMIAIARSKRAHPRITYRLIQDGQLDFIDDNSIDGAMTCYVMINTDSEERIARFVREIYRVLKVGSPYMILDTNPASTGIEFSTFTNGRAGKVYGYGESREEWLHIPGEPDLVLHDYHWPKEMYQSVLQAAGFSHIEHYEPTLRDIPADELRAFEAAHGPCDWRGEWDHPPFIIFRALK